MKQYFISKDKAIKKVEIAIDKMIDLQDAGYGNDTITRTLERLNSLIIEIEILN